MIFQYFSLLHSSLKALGTKSRICVMSSSLPWSFWLILSHSNVFFTWWRLRPEDDLKILLSLFSRFDLTSWFYSRSESSFLNAVVSFWMKSLWLHSYSLITYCSLILLINSPSRKRWFLKIAFQMFYNMFYLGAHLR